MSILTSGSIVNNTIPLDKVSSVDNQKKAEAAALEAAERNEALNTPKIFGEFGSIQEAEAAYRLLKENSQAPKVPEAPQAPEKPQEAPKSPEAPKTPEAPPEGKGGPLKAQDLAKYSEEFIKTGKLSEESYKALLERGLDKDLVDSYIQLSQVKAQALVTDAVSVIGGMDNYKSLVAWGAQHLTPEDQKAFDSAVSDLSRPDVVKAALIKLKSTYEAFHGKFPEAPLSGETLDGGKTPEGTSGFSSYEELAAAMKDPRYTGIGGRPDPAYRKMVETKLAKSRI